VTGTRNALKCSHSPAEEDPHRKAKFVIANYCWKVGLDFQTEVTFNNSTRADIVIEDWTVAFEVLYSESLKKCFKKDYPLPIIPVDARMNDTSLIAMMEDLEQTNGKGHDYYVRLAKEGDKWYRRNLKECPHSKNLSI